MSDHVWASENIAAYLAGGLNPTEGERLEKHAAQCDACAHSLDEARAMESKLAPLFRHAKPGAALEDRIIHSLLVAPPAEKPRRAFHLSWKAKSVLAVAATLLLAFVGFGVNKFIDEDRFGPAGQDRVLVSKKLGTGTMADYQRLATTYRHPGANEQPPATKKSPPDGTSNTITLDENEKESKSLKSAAELAKELGKLTKNLEIAEHNSSTAKTKIDIEDAIRKVETAKKDPKAGDDKKDIFQFWIGVEGKKNGKSTEEGWGFITDNKTKEKDKYKAGGESGYVWRYTNKGDALNPLGKDYFKPGEGIYPVGEKGEKKEGESKQGGGGRGEGPGKEDGKSGDKGTGNEKGPGQDGNKKDPPGDKKQDDTGVKKPEQFPQVVMPRKIIIRTGELEFEIDSFDASLSDIMKLVTKTKGGFVATINSDKLANGKVRGSVVVRMPPEQLDQFILDLRKELAKTGELKNQRLGSEDISKSYFDLESRLKAARTMEQRLLNIIKDGKGQIKDLLQAEKELGVWRTKIEEMEGEIRYYNNLVSLATLTIKMYEKDIRMAAVVTENERVQAGIEVEDVEKAHKEALKAILDTKGRISRSELKQHAAGQFNAILHFEVDPEKAGPLRDRLKQIGTMVRLQIDRVQVTSNGGQFPKDGKVQRGDTQFMLSIYNLANVAPRETIVLRIAAADVPAIYQKLRDKIAKVKGHIVNANLDEKDRQNITAQLDFDVNRAGQAEIQAELTAAGENLSRQVTRVPDSDNVTDAKVLYRLVLVDADSIQPRETVTMKIAAVDVPAAYQKLRDAFGKAKARIINAKLDEQDRRNIVALLEFTFHRKDEGVVQIALTGAGETLSKQVTRLPESPTLTDSKVLVRMELIQADSLPPRETVTLKVASNDVATAYENLRNAVTKAKGRIANALLTEEDRRNVKAFLIFDVPRNDESAIQLVLSAAGEALARKVERQQENAAVTDTKVGFKVELVPAATIAPREITSLAMEVSDVSGTLRDFNAQVNEIQGRIVKTDVGQEVNGQVIARVEYDVPLTAAGSLVEKFKSAGQVRVHQVKRDPEAPEGKLALARIVVTLSNADVLVPSDKGFWSQIRHGLGVSLRGLAYSLYLLIIGVLFVVPWALLIYAAFLLVRRMVRHQTLATAAPEAPAGNVPTAPAG